MRQRDILRFWLPLCASWVLMLAEGPVVSAVVNRLPDAVTQLAAVGLVVSLAVTIESPIINLLATATALAHDARAYRETRRFSLHWLIALTAVSILLVLPPVFDLVVVRWLGAPTGIARWVHPALTVMIPWSAAVGWRRFLQGVLIAANRTGAIVRGTVLRLAVSAGGAVALAFGTDLRGAVVGATALVAGVIFEAAYITRRARPIIAALPEVGEEEVTYRRLAAFHLPLAMTSVVTLLMQPLVAATLARLDRPVATLAAWPILFQFLLLARAAAYALPEAVIALRKRPESESAVRRFSLSLTGLGLLAMTLFALTPLSGFYLERLQGAAGEVVEIARVGFVYLIPLVPLATLISWRRGELMHRGRTGPIHTAMMVRLAVTVALLVVGLAVGGRGVVVGAVALVASIAAEYAVLERRFSKRRPHPAEPSG